MQGRLITSATTSSLQLSSSIHADIKDLLQQVTVTQKYQNTSDDPLDITYSYDLPMGAAVSTFYAEIDGKKIKSVLKEKEAAKNDYDDAVASGHGAFLAEQGRPSPR